MERLTERDEFGSVDIIGVDSMKLEYDVGCDVYDKLTDAMEKLAEYEYLEEQGKLLKLPCAVGDTVYVIPSKTNYKLNILNGRKENNRVYEQVVNRIEIFGNGYLLTTCDGMQSVVDKFYKETWFLTLEEAEAALEKLSGDAE